MEHVLFETARLVVARFTHNDLDNFYQVNSHPDVMRYIRAPKTYEECKAFLDENIHYYSEQPFMGRWKMTEKETGTFVGSYAIIPIDGTADIQLGYALMPAYWGKGFATESTRGGIAFAFAHLPVEKLYAVTETGNTASQQVLLKCGFTEIYTYTSTDGKELKRFIMWKPVLD